MENWFSTDPTGKHTGNSFLHRFEWFASMILSDLPRSGEISSRYGLISSRFVEISSRFGLISLRSTKISSILVKSSKNKQILEKSDDNLHSLRLDRKMVMTDHSNCCLRRVDDRSRFRKLEVIGSVLGWAQTQPRPTCGQPYVCVCVSERERERERERDTDDTCCDYKSSCWGEQNYCAYKVEESQAIDAFEDISRPQYLSWYRFLGKLKLGIIFMEWVEWIMNLNYYDFLFLFLFLFLNDFILLNILFICCYLA